MLKTVVEDWGLIDYERALERQLERVAEVQADPEKQFVLICSHNPVATLGRKTKAEDLHGWQGETVEIQRGGRVTYHGPGQLVVYPVLDLRQERQQLKARDLHGYLRRLEDFVIELVGEYGVRAARAPGNEFLAMQKDVEATGVWVGDRKLASIGIGVKKWVTYHGLALNVVKDPGAFQGMNPCGFQKEVMTSLEEQTGEVDGEAVKARAKDRLATFFD